MTKWYENGKVIDDQRLSDDKYRITSAEPNLDWLEHNSSGLNLKVDDDSSKTAVLALQGPNSRFTKQPIIMMNTPVSIENRIYWRFRL